MPNEKIIYIEDQQGSIETFTRALRRLYGKEYLIEAIKPLSSLPETLDRILSAGDAVAFFLDEKLSLSGEANFHGTDLAEAIREFDYKVPVYILTSYSSEIDPLNENVEYILDKNDFGYPDRRHKIAKRLLRHVNTFKEIKNKRSHRFDQLLKKSLTEGLTTQEQQEYENLNFLRVKRVLATEEAPSLEQENNLIEREKIIETISKKIKEIKG